MTTIDPANLIRRLEHFGVAFHGLLTGVTTEDARWKPPSGAWSILEVVAHLGDEEVEDFRARLMLVLKDPAEAWPRLDPEGVAVSRRYNEMDLGTCVRRFVEERRRSVAWLRSLENPDWSLAYVHPRFGPTYAGDLLASWQAHDALHLRQIAKRMYELAGRDAPGFRTGYAGEWRA